MNILGKITKTEWSLIALTVLFLLLCALAYPKQEQKALNAGFSVTVSREAQERVTPAAPEKVNINTADADKLETLSGIGPVTAGRIIEYREAHGPFREVEDLLNVDGIGEATLAKFRDHVTVG